MIMQRDPYQIENVQIVFQHEALHGPLEIGKYSQGLGRRERGRKGGGTKLGWTVSLIWTCRDIGGLTVNNVKKNLHKIKKSRRENEISDVTGG